MALTPEQEEKIKEQLLQQIENLPEDKKEDAKEQILSMSSEELEEFLQQNSNECIFCSIAQGKIPSYKIAEDSENLAILEINPLSIGNSLVVPKNHESKPSVDFAKKIAEKLKIFSPKEVKIIEKNIMGHNILEILPLYGTEKERKKAQPEQLNELQKMITQPQKTEKKQEPKKELPKEEPLHKIKPRIP